MAGFDALEFGLVLIEIGMQRGFVGLFGDLAGQHAGQYLIGLQRDDLLNSGRLVELTLTRLLRYGQHFCELLGQLALATT